MATGAVGHLVWRPGNTAPHWSSTQRSPPAVGTAPAWRAPDARAS